MPRSYQVAVLGADNAVGREIVALLGERGFPCSQLHAYAAQSAPAALLDDKIAYEGHPVTLHPLEQATMEGIDVVFNAVDDPPSALLEGAKAAGALVVSSDAGARGRPDVPLIVPELGIPVDAAAGDVPWMAAGPLPIVVQTATVLAPLAHAKGLTRIVLSTYEAASGMGKAGIDEFGDQVAALFNQRDITPTTFPTRIAFNCIPQVGSFLPDAPLPGATSAETAVRSELRRVLGAPALQVDVTCVRVPVFNGHGAAVVADLQNPITLPELRQLLHDAPGVIVEDTQRDGGYPTPTASDGSDATWVGRLRVDGEHPNVVAFWCVADNLRKGTATNLVQIAEILLRQRHAKPNRARQRKQ